MKMLWVLAAVAAVLLGATAGNAQPAEDSWTQWEVHQDGNARLAEDMSADGWKALEWGQPFSGNSGGAWLRAQVLIPERIGGASVAGSPLGLRINSDFGGEIFVNGRLQMRYDNDHPGMALLTRRAVPGESVNVHIRAFRDVHDHNKEQKLGLAQFDLVSRERVLERADIRLDARDRGGRLPDGYWGMSQGAGMASYSDETAARFREMGVKWFRMDNIFTNAVTREADGSLKYNWEDFDRRLDFMDKIGCQFIACASYMPEALEAFPNKDRHARPADYGEWEELCYQAARRAIETGHRIPYWEVWNEANSGWLVPAEGEDGLEEYLKLYDATWRGVRRADPKALIGGPCNASGPWNTSPERGYAVNGEKFMRGLIKHCAETGAPLDFVSWHEYFHPPSIILEEADVTREYLSEYPGVASRVREFMITEWNYAWWVDWPQDHELGAAWAANSILRAMIPGRVDKPCFFYAMDFSPGFKGEWGILTHEGKPKASFNVAKMFNMLAPQRLQSEFEDPELAILPSVDPKTGRVAVLLLNYAEGYGVERQVRLRVSNLSEAARDGRVRIWSVGPEQSNVFHNQERAELEKTAERPVQGSLLFEDLTLAPNSITLVEVLPAGAAK